MAHTHQLESSKIPFPEALSAWIKGHPDPSYFGESDANRLLKMKLVLAQCQLFWERDLQPWEKEAVLHLIGRCDDKGLRHAMFLLTSPADLFGDFQETAPLREMYRAAFLKDHLRSAPISNDPRSATLLKSTWSVFSSAALIMVSAYNCDKPLTRLFCSAFVTLGLALTASPFIYTAAVLPLSTPTLAALTTLSTAATIGGYMLLTQTLNGTVDFLERKDALRFLNKAFFQGLNKRFKQSLSQPSFFHALEPFMFSENRPSYDSLSLKIQQAIPESVFRDNIKIIPSRDTAFVSHYEAKLAHVEAMELSHALTHTQQQTSTAHKPPLSPDLERPSPPIETPFMTLENLMATRSKRMVRPLRFSKLLQRYGIRLQATPADPVETVKKTHTAQPRQKNRL